MKISLCIPCMNRVPDLIRVTPHLFMAANASPPAEIAVLDYNSQDGLGEYIEFVRDVYEMKEGNELTYNRYEGRDHYHLAHAWNLAVLASSGEYVVIMGADAVLDPGYVSTVRKLIAGGCVWMRGRHYKGIIAIQREAFVAAGGYDERIEFYGGEDKELEQRLLRRGIEPCVLPDGLARTLRTSNPDKVANYRLNLSKREMMKRGTVIRKSSAAQGTLVANEGKAWGQYG